MAPQATLTNPRTAEVIEANYSNACKQVREQIEALCDEGETDLNRILTIMSTRYIKENYAKAPGQTGNGSAASKKLEEQIDETGFLFERRRIVPRQYDFVTLMRMFETVQISTFVSNIEPDIGRVIELGSGWGRVLLKVWAMGGPREAEYIGCELTSSGRALSERIAEIGGVPDFRAERFDYTKPDFSFLQDNIPTVVITNHSVEEVAELPDALIDRMCEIPGFRRCVHLEPVGFQIEDESWLPDADERRRIDGINAAHAEKFNRNRNLISLLERKAAEGRIEIETIRKNYLGIVVENSTSLVVWKPR